MRAVAYYRVSTRKQGRDGLGMDAQRNAVEAFCQPIESFTEVESGRRPIVRNSLWQSPLASDSKQRW